jgi:ABC-type branched-subunit amino acid transport system ATPase component
MTKVIVFCIAAFFAAVSGVLYGSALHVASTTDSYFTAFNGLILVAVLALAPFGPPWYALFAGLTVVIPSFFSGPHTNAWLNVIFGVFAMLVAVQGGPAQMPQALRRFLDRLGGRGPALALAGAGTTTAALDQGPVVPAHHASPVPEPTGPVEAGPGSVKETTGLEVTNLTVRFGGLVAVNALSFDVPMGRITGLIGPNGAGKTTTFNACSGLVRPTEGEIFLHGKAITRTGPPGRARAGLGRTFQRTDLGEALSVHENVALGHEARLAGAGLRSQFFATKAEKHETADAVNDAIELCGIADLRDTPVGLLSTGQRRLVELARCLAGSYDVLLLDEPSSGLDQLETAALADALVEVVRHRGCGVLLVEHNVELVMKFCSHIYVMDFGKLMFEGDATAVAESPTVREVYLGEPIAASKEEAL